MIRQWTAGVTPQIVAVVVVVVVVGVVPVCVVLCWKIGGSLPTALSLPRAQWFCPPSRKYGMHTFVRGTKSRGCRGLKARPLRGPGNCTGVPLQTIAAAVAVGRLCQGSDASRSEGKTALQTLRVHGGNVAQLLIDRRRGEP